MFDNMFGDMQEKQEAMQKRLSETFVEAEAGDGAVVVKANGNRQIVNIQINKDSLNWDDSEEVEDLVLVAVNKALEAAAAKETAESENMLKDFLPPGMGDMSNLFGG
ncbi:MAG: YbaB/EbfC family nucleoid-associated protein [Bacteroidota bacterium]